MLEVIEAVVIEQTVDQSPVACLGFLGTLLDAFGQSPLVGAAGAHGSAVLERHEAVHMRPPFRVCVDVVDHGVEVGGQRIVGVAGRYVF